MIQSFAEHKYSFNIQVSAEDMAALDRDHSRRKAHLVWQRLTRAFDQLRTIPRAPLCGELLTEVATRSRALELHKPVMHSAIVCLRKPMAPPYEYYAANWSAHRPALRLHIQSVFVSGDAFGELCAAQQAIRLHTRANCDLAAVSDLLNRKEKGMSKLKLTRRSVAAAATGVATIGLLGAPAKSANAYRGNMEHALSSLNQALASLRESTANKGGHRARALDLIRQAIDETQTGIEFADEHGGG
jgi:hypothetical protein